ncbi:Uma2 family endonuclease [Streptomyces sp. ACA25]|uniref:Uma2 family endonuclease n=1 Tax=Streptomyces sp. ACA25 TaxID=3022596 RepID=UPI0023076B4E|nr:Uma2 family endonuclease [Streptomyces sp. ACA25]MDB1086046.1 Uma2 family endonuclease [Streptomyces sp. ACA25]
MATDEPPRTRDDSLLDDFLGLETPRGRRAELIEGDIVMTPPPDGEHEDFLSTVIRQVLSRSRSAMDVSGHKGLVLPSSASYWHNRVVPDATFAPRELRLFRNAPVWMDPDGVALVAEVTNGNPARDRAEKRSCYARSSLPLYLLVDRERSTVTLHSEPSDGSYTEIHSVPFGKPVRLPGPFGFDLATTDLL